jgi:rubrerythrin
MWLIRGRTIVPGSLAVALVVGIALVVAGASAKVAHDAAPRYTITADTTSGPPPGSLDTRTNLQTVFGNEVNAKERYLEFAKCADREGHPEVAVVFRALARAEQAHADRHVQAIALLGDEARAMMTKSYVGTTRENLGWAIEMERYEATVLYPALRDRALADHQSAAVRSLTLALAAEREHVELLTEALANLDAHVQPRPLYVCPFCGKTVVTRNFKKCPCCFTDARKFVKVT